MSHDDTPYDGPPVGWQLPLVSLILSVTRHRRLVGAILVLGVVAAGLRLATTAPYYRAAAVAVLLPREKPTVDAMVVTSSLRASQDRSERADSAALLLPPNPDLYIALLTSRAVVDSIAKRFDDRLPPAGLHSRSDEMATLIRGMVKFDATDEGLLTVTVTSHDAELAADIANALIDEGREASKAIERQLILQQAGYLDRAVHDARADLELVESQLREFHATHGLIDPSVQAGATLNQLKDAALRRDRALEAIARRELHHTAEDPEMRRLRAEVRALDRRIEELEGGVVGGAGIAEFGSLLVRHESLRDQVRAQRDLTSILASQAGIFAIRAREPAGTIAVVRPAVAPSSPAGPSKKLLVGVSIGSALLLGVGVSLLLDQWAACRDVPAFAARMAELRAQLTRRSPGPA
jgi:uncharacterized protein involved in exopolysaccharide biosynthesis